VRRGVIYFVGFLARGATFDFIHLPSSSRASSSRLYALVLLVPCCTLALSLSLLTLSSSLVTTRDTVYSTRGPTSTSSPPEPCTRFLFPGSFACYVSRMLETFSPKLFAQEIIYPRIISNLALSLSLSLSLSLFTKRAHLIILAIAIASITTYYPPPYPSQINFCSLTRVSFIYLRCILLYSYLLTLIIFYQTSSQS
jgi:hypothetical protein